MQTARSFQRELRGKADPDKATALRRYFKTGPGEYGEGDTFLGIPVPVQRNIAKRYAALSLPELGTMLMSKVHEYRFSALEALVAKYEAGDLKERRQVARFYLAHARFVNNWDLVDTSASYILGKYLFTTGETRILRRLARSKNLWERRISIIATHHFIKNDSFEISLEIAAMLRNDPHDLIHKAVGWTLREVGKRSPLSEKEFLRMHASQMPRTMLRYAIELFPKGIRANYLNIPRKEAK
jgi:3-methyladenine DNA glycosylase AlkD